MKPFFNEHKDVRLKGSSFFMAIYKYWKQYTSEIEHVWKLTTAQVMTPPFYLRWQILTYKQVLALTRDLVCTW